MMRWAGYCTILMAYIGASEPVRAQDIPVIAPTRFQDIPEEEGFVAAPNWMVGLHLMSARAERVPRLLTFLPDNFVGGVLCVEAITIDGRFAATAQYDVAANWAGQGVELEYPTAFPNIWSRSSLADSGVVVSIGACEKRATPEAQVLPSVLNGLGAVDRTTDGEVTLVFNIHARKTSELLARLNTGAGTLSVPCEKLETLDAIKFNFTCRVTLPQEATGIGVFEYTRLNNGRARDGHPAQIVLPALK